MPEGDTIHILAAELGRRLAGRRLSGGRLREEPGLALAGRRVEEVSAHGKHLFVALGGELVLRSHLGLHGTWHRYRPGERWRKPARHAAVVLETEDDVLVCFHPEEVEILDRARQERFRLARDLGPDLVRGAPEGAELARRARRFLAPDAPLVDLLLDQRVAAGIGNVYKSEVLFLERLHPRAPSAALDEPALERVYATAHRLLASNLRGGPRTTRPAGDGRGGLWVYGRRDRACLNCAARIVGARLGRGLRSTYWCPRCQAEGSRDGAGEKRSRRRVPSGPPRP